MALSSTYLRSLSYKVLTLKEVFKRSRCVHNSSLSVAESSEASENALRPVSQDLSSITPYFSNTFNLAAYVNNSETLKNLVDLNVNISKIEKKPYIVHKFLTLDFEKDMKNHIIYLNNFVEMDEIGNFLTKNPMILCEKLEDLEVRVNYLQSKAFKNNEIKRIIVKNPFWLMFSTLRIDKRLGYFQNCLNLRGQELRDLATKQPKLITYNLHHVKCNMFIIKEEMGFNDEEVKKLVMMKPKLLMLSQTALEERFNYIHNVMKIPHENIMETPEILMCRKFRLKQRHLFLEKLGRSQYDPKKPNYIPLKSMIEDTDVEFCRNFAKCSVNDFNIFLKTL
ncbi:hypothetical protein B5X24_HaOG217145 [Helicoverpa armigera]|uniref:Transcription termination factor 3, mitochondrial n=1 Tax=Helicoverpa armigera TaxID=29058 RepID=A0A2W1BV23_HELAM|nr:hypothetical protein B5X24_HaOG217145 [Helicoverpa armigera]